MRTLTDLALNKMVQKYIDSLSHVLYTLNVDNRIYERTSDKALYVAFKYEFTEV